MLGGRHMCSKAKRAEFYSAQVPLLDDTRAAAR